VVAEGLLRQTQCLLQIGAQQLEAVMADGHLLLAMMTKMTRKKKSS